MQKKNGTSYTVPFFFRIVYLSYLAQLTNNFIVNQFLRFQANDGISALFPAVSCKMLACKHQSKGVRFDFSSSVCLGFPALMQSGGKYRYNRCCHKGTREIKSCPHREISPLSRA
nr:MAG TPA: hypothetical protein [Caudoviricetes sp.]